MTGRGGAYFFGSLFDILNYFQCLSNQITYIAKIISDLISMLLFRLVFFLCSDTSNEVKTVETIIRQLALRSDDLSASNERGMSHRAQKKRTKTPTKQNQTNIRSSSCVSSRKLGKFGVMPASDTDRDIYVSIYIYLFFGFQRQQLCSLTEPSLQGHVMTRFCSRNQSISRLPLFSSI